jgi:hypothetical protein
MPDEVMLSIGSLTAFSTLFIRPASAGGANIFDFNILIAIVAYALLSYVVVSFVRVIFHQES